MSTTPTPGPRPVPRPGPRPGANVAARPSTRPAQTTPTIPPNNPADYGRIDDDGTVWLRTAEGERAIGEWKAGSHEEGLAHYGHRFENLATEVELLAHRILTHPLQGDHTRKTARDLQTSLETAAVLGDIERLKARLADIIESSFAAETAAKEAKAQRRQAAIDRKTALAAEAEDIAEKSTDWKAAGDRLSAIVDEWRTIRGIERSTDDALWKRFAAARDAFNRRRGSHFADLDRARATARRIKEDLCEKAEALKDSTDWGATAQVYRDLMTEWKAAGRAPREVDDKLWERFRAARDHFYNHRAAVNEARDAEFQANADAKQALIDEYTPLITPEKDLEGAKKALHELAEKWEEIGFVPRDRVREFEDKIRALEKKVQSAQDDQWRRTDPALQARAAQFTAKVDELMAAAADAEARGKAKDAENLRAQAEQWREWAQAASEAIDG